MLGVVSKPFIHKTVSTGETERKITIINFSMTHG